MTTISIRRLLPNDSLEDMTEMLHRAFAPMGERGLNCTCVDQSLETTRQRVALGDCFVAVSRQRIVGTITLHRTDRYSPVAWYRHPQVASLHQFAVDPGHQGDGIGLALLRAGEQWALSRRFHTLALDTPEPARHLHAYYGRQGFGVKGAVQLPGRTYQSVILGKAIGVQCRRPSLDTWPPRHPFEMALLARTTRA